MANMKKIDIKKTAIKSTAAVATVMTGAAALEAVNSNHVADAIRVKFTSNEWWHFYNKGIEYKDSLMIQIEGEIGFCLEPLSYIDSRPTSDYPYEKVKEVKNDPKLTQDLELIAHYGFYSQSQSADDYKVTQTMIWERVMGSKYIIKGRPDLEAKKPQIQKKIDAYKANASFNGSTHKMKIGETLTLTDKNHWLSTVQAVATSSNPAIESKVEGDNLILKAVGAESGTVKLNVGMEKPKGVTIVYATDKTTIDRQGKKWDIQDVGVLRLRNSDPNLVTVNISGSMSIHTEKSVSAANRLLTDQEYKDATNGKGDLSKTLFALYKDGKPVKWSDKESIQSATTVSKGKKVDGDEVKVYADESGEVQIDHLNRKGDYELQIGRAHV